MTLGAKGDAFFEWLVAVGSVLCVSLNLGYKMWQLSIDPATYSASTAQKRYLMWSVVPSIIAGAGYSWLANRDLSIANALDFDLGRADTLANLLSWERPAFISHGLIAMVKMGVIVWLIAAIGALCKLLLSQDHEQRSRLSSSHIFCWLGGAIGAAIALYCGNYFLHYLTVSIGHRISERVLVILGLPWSMLSLLIGQILYTLFSANLITANVGRGDREREWLARAGAWNAITAGAWMVLAATVIGASMIPEFKGILGAKLRATLSAFTMVSGAVTAVLGASGLTPARGSPQNRTGLVVNILLAILGPLFAISLLALLSLMIDWFGPSAPKLVRDACCTSVYLFGEPMEIPIGGYGQVWSRLIGIAVLLLTLTLGAAYLVNVNRFSLHSLYRNRLIRAFLGASRERKPDPFTDFDERDNLYLAEVRSSLGRNATDDWKPIHVVNIALNLSSDTELAHQQRKAISFTVTPLASGSAELGYRNTSSYGGPNSGISLGTAMAISGAAVSPNQGYHSSPSIAFLLTLFNVRLGWWLGNPGEAGDRKGLQLIKKLLQHDRPLEPYRQNGPWFALGPLLAELFCITNRKSPYVYLSDGGHFENLGLYEMVRRRCRWIVMCDAGQDKENAFEDLGNAVRKIWIDFGIRIEFEPSDMFAEPRKPRPGFAFGTIQYLADCDAQSGGPPPKGHILYLKPRLKPDECAADIIAYARANCDFPHETTTDQWFNESQLEAYRALGYLMMKDVFNTAKIRLGRDPATLADLCP
jgi:hypothetical protein